MAQNQYVLYTIHTVSILPSFYPHQSFSVQRRFSDFEHLLSLIKCNQPDLVSMLPQLPRKRLHNNLESCVINSRKYELEGFLHLLFNKTDPKIYEEEALRAFLTYDSKQYRQFRDKNSTFLNNLWRAYESVPNCIDLQNALKQASLTISGVAEPQELFHDGARLDCSALK